MRLVTNLTFEDIQTWDLEIRKIRLEDEGNYVCRVMNNGETLKRVIHLKVEVTMLIEPSNPVVNFKDSIIIFCNTSYIKNLEDENRPSVHHIGIEWFKNLETYRLNFHHNANSTNYVIENSFSPTFSSQLKIINIKSSNIGTYICKFRMQNVSTTLKKSNSKFIINDFIFF